MGEQPFRFGKKPLDFQLQFRRNNFVGVQPQNPFRTGLFGCGVFLPAEAFPRFTESFCAKFLRDFIRSVVNIVVEHNDDFFRPARNALQHAPDACRLGSGNYANGNGQSFLSLYHAAFMLKRAPITGISALLQG